MVPIDIALPPSLDPPGDRPAWLVAARRMWWIYIGLWALSGFVINLIIATPWFNWLADQWFAGVPFPALAYIADQHHWQRDAAAEFAAWQHLIAFYAYYGTTCILLLLLNWRYVRLRNIVAALGDHHGKGLGLFVAGMILYCWVFTLDYVYLGMFHHGGPASQVPERSLELADFARLNYGVGLGAMVVAGAMVATSMMPPGWSREVNNWYRAKVAASWRNRPPIRW